MTLPPARRSGLHCRDSSERAASHQPSCSTSMGLGDALTRDGMLPVDVVAGGGSDAVNGGSGHASGNDTAHGRASSAVGERNPSQLISDTASTSGRSGTQHQRLVNEYGQAYGLHAHRSHAPDHAHHGFFTEEEHADAESVPTPYCSYSELESDLDFLTASPADRRPRRRRLAVAPLPRRRTLHRRQRRAFRFTISQTSEVDLFSGDVEALLYGLPPQPQRIDPQAPSAETSAGAAPHTYIVHMFPPAASRAHAQEPVLHVHCSVDGGRRWWSQALVRVQGAQRPLLTAQLRAPAHAHRRQQASSHLAGRQEPPALMLLVSDQPLCNPRGENPLLGAYNRCWAVAAVVFIAHH